MSKRSQGNLNHYTPGQVDDMWGQPVPTYPEGRKCLYCGKPLSIYNESNFCHLHKTIFEVLKDKFKAKSREVRQWQYNTLRKLGYKKRRKNEKTR